MTQIFTDERQFSLFCFQLFPAWL